MIEGMEKYVGLKLKESVIKYKLGSGNEKGYYIITRPDFYSDSIHINMYIHFNEDRVITDFNGDKCYSVYRGMYDRSAAVYDREFTKRDIQFLRSFVRDNVEDPVLRKKMKKYKIGLGTCGGRAITTSIINAHDEREAVIKFLKSTDSDITEEKIALHLKNTFEYIPKQK